jgi:hypothetical protein
MTRSDHAASLSRLTGTSLASIDFTTVEVWTLGGLVTYSLLFVWKAISCRKQVGDEGRGIRSRKMEKMGRGRAPAAPEESFPGA